MSMYGFYGGPWNGFVIEYADGVSPDDQVRPGARDPKDEGRYLLHRWTRAYVWSDRTALGRPG